MSKTNMVKKVLGLCEGRHTLPSNVEGYIFPQQLSLDFVALDNQCHKVLSDCAELELYVTGFTPALTTVISYCCRNLISLTLYHFDRESRGYIPQYLSTDYWRGMLEENELI